MSQIVLENRSPLDGQGEHLPLIMKGGEIYKNSLGS